MQDEQPRIERRRYRRARVRGDIILRGAGREVHAHGVVISETALEVSCQLGFAVLAMAGVSVEIEMRLAGTDSWFFMHGHVARIRAADHSLVIAIAALPEPLATLLADERACVAPVEVIVIDRDRGRRADVSEAFRTEGCHVVEAATSDEALEALATARVATDVIVVADTAPDSIAIELRCALQSYPHALVVGVGGAEWIPTGVRLDPDDTDHSLRARVHSLLLERAMSGSVDAPPHTLLRMST